LAKRIDLAKLIGKFKMVNSLPIQNRNVEKQVILRSKQKAKEIGLSPDFIEKIFLQLIEEAVKIQNFNKILLNRLDQFTSPIFNPIIKNEAIKENPVIAFQGDLGAYSHLCVMENFPNAKPLPSEKFDTTFQVLKQNNVDYALVPLENSLGGPVFEVFKLLEQIKIVIVQEILFKVDHMLIASHNDYTKIKLVFSHPQALLQCRNFLKTKSLKTKEFNDTAGSVKYLARHPELKHIAAIGSRQAAELYRMNILEESIQDNPLNFTRFLLIRKARK
jgi:hypothetical protein